MESIDQGLEFLNYENVCQAEKEILQNILQGADSKEYSKGLFAFDTPFSENVTETGHPAVFEFGQGECQFFSDASGETVCKEVNEEQLTESTEVDEEVSAEGNGANNLAMSEAPLQEPNVSQVEPPHAVPNYYSGQTHLPVAVSATSAPISSVGPVPPSNQMLMYGMPPMMPPQSYYPHPPYYGQQGGNPQHMSYVPVDNSEGYMSPHSQGQNHHKLHHDPHHSSGGPPPPNSSGQVGGNNSYGKQRRKQQQQQPPPYFYGSPYYAPVPYYNQQQLQNVTGPPIIMGPGGMYVSQHPAMYQGPPGNELEHHSGNLPSMVPIPNDMSFAQHQYPGSPVYSHNNARNYNPSHNNAHRGTGAASQQSDVSVVSSEVRVAEKQSPTTTNENDFSTSSQTPKSLPDLTNSNYTEGSSPDKDASPTQESLPHNSSLDSNTSNKSNPVVSEVPIVNGDLSSNSSSVNVSSRKSEKSSEQQNNDILGKKNVTNNNASNLVHSSKTQVVEVVTPPPPSKQANGDIDTESSENNKSSKNRDNTSADRKSKSDVTIDQSSSKSSKSSSDTAKSSSNNNNCSRSVSTPSAPRTDPKSNEISTLVDASKSSPSIISVQNEVKPQVVGRSWASIASVKSQNIPNNGAAARNAMNNHTPQNNYEEQHYGVTVPPKLSGSSHVPSLAEGAEGSEPMDWEQTIDENDPVAVRLGEHLSKYVLDHQSTPLIPRGLYNQSNSCFLNAILQALLACPPFVNIFRSISYISDKAPCKSAPVTQHVFEFIREFTPLIRANATTKKDKSRDFVPGSNLEPSGIRKSLALLSKDTFKIEGRQEDAEEFLSFLLNYLHEEMIKLMKINEAKKGGGVIEISEKIETPVNGEALKEDDDDWQVMGAKNKSCLTRRTAVTKSPISEAFLGQMCLSLSRVNSLKKAHLEPFFTLQLAIQNENIKSVKDALEAISIKEEVSGMTSATGSEVEAWRQVSLEELPPVLILHLKRFVYEKNGILKINKKLEYSVDLEIGKDLLSTNSKSKYTLKQRQYKLFAVVYHDGEDAHKGHYVVDCFHPSGGSMWGPWGWLRHDDTSVKPVSEANMLNPSHPRVPYLLFYRRQDTIVQQQQKKGS